MKKVRAKEKYKATDQLTFCASFKKKNQLSKGRKNIAGK